MKRTKHPPARLGHYEMVFSDELQIDQIVWPKLLEPDPELEAARDLHKPLEQLLADVHRENNTKRLASMMLRVVKSNDRLSCLVTLLSVVAVVLAAIQTMPLLLSIPGWLSSVLRCGH